MTYKTLVVYETARGMGNVFMTSNVPYNTADRIEELRNYISKEYMDGAQIVILNLIQLEG